MLISPGTNVRLKDHDPEDTGPYNSKNEVGEKLDELREELAELQELLYAENRHSALIVLQGLDTAGKSGTIRHVMSGLNPVGIQVVPFKVPSQEELDHDFLWRIHKHTPRYGDIAIFDRSHYEDVLAVRVHELVRPKIWKARYEQINLFEKILSENNTVILKFFLHISKREQKQRLQARLDDPKKRWKFALGDLNERALWDEYQRAYEDALSQCSTEWAPWHVVPADRKWYRNLYVAETIVQTLRSLKMKYPDPTEDLSKVVIK